MDTLDYACRAYVQGEIDVDELEAAVEHVLRGGLGNARFPYLPAFPAPAGTASSAGDELVA